MARRIGASSIKWAELAERVSEAQRPQYLAFKAKSDGYLRRVLANPEAPPKIDWTAYKNKVAVTGLVDSFQKSYEALSIPYPADTVSTQIDSQEKEVKSSIDSFVQTSKSNIEGHKAEIAKIESLIPYSEMTLEEFAIAHPDIAINVDKPTVWPHYPEDQMGYVDKNATPDSH